MYSTQNFSSFYVKMWKLIIKKLDTILSEITFDNDVVKRLEAYFLKLIDWIGFSAESAIVQLFNGGSGFD